MRGHFSHQSDKKETASKGAPSPIIPKSASQKDNEDTPFFLQEPVEGLEKDLSLPEDENHTLGPALPNLDEVENPQNADLSEDPEPPIQPHIPGAPVAEEPVGDKKKNNKKKTFEPEVPVPPTLPERTDDPVIPKTEETENHPDFLETPLPPSRSHIPDLSDENEGKTEPEMAAAEETVAPEVPVLPNIPNIPNPIEESEEKQTPEESITAPEVPVLPNIPESTGDAETEKLVSEETPKVSESTVLPDIPNIPDPIEVSAEENREEVKDEISEPSIPVLPKLPEEETVSETEPEKHDTEETSEFTESTVLPDIPNISDPIEASEENDTTKESIVAPDVPNLPNIPEMKKEGDSEEISEFSESTVMPDIPTIPDQTEVSAEENKKEVKDKISEPSIPVLPKLPEEENVSETDSEKNDTAETAEFTESTVLPDIPNIPDPMEESEENITAPDIPVLPNIPETPEENYLETVSEESATEETSEFTESTVLPNIPNIPDPTEDIDSNGENQENETEKVIAPEVPLPPTRPEVIEEPVLPPVIENNEEVAPPVIAPQESGETTQDEAPKIPASEETTEQTDDQKKQESAEEEKKDEEVTGEEQPEEKVIDYKSEDFLSSLFANGTTCLTEPNGDFPIKDETRSVLVLFSNGRFFVAENAKFDGKVLGFEYLARKRRLQIGKPEYVPTIIINDIYEYAAKQSDKTFVPPTVESSAQEEVRMQRDFVTIVSRAAASRVSDIHVVVADHTTILFRVNGLMQTEMEYNREWGESFVRSAFASADISDANYAQNEYQAAQKLGRTPLRGSGGKLLLPRNVLGIRLQFNPIAFGTRYVVMRLLYAEDNIASAADLTSLGFSEEQNKIFYKMRAIPTGMIVISGPTGSGKSTTLQRNMIAMLQERNYEINLITVEDPPEYPIPGARQMPVTNAMVEETKEREFTKALSAALRSDPDALMIGEIRTLSAADLAFRGALSGHNVWTTLHANSAPAILMRLKDIGVENFKLQDPSLMKGLMAQRLFRKVCPCCRLKASDNLKHPAVERLRRAFGDVALDLCYLRGPGCEVCDHRGVKGRTVVGEFIQPDATFLDLSIKGEFRKAQNYWINDLGGETLRDSAVSHMLKGEVDIEEVEKWTGFLDQQVLV